jgi:hypoxanthine phosphoribosyltransferase
MKGAVVFGSHLAEKINDILKNDIKDSYNMKYFFEYITSSSYENDQSTGKLKVNADPSLLEKLNNQNIVIVEDIYDSGFSLIKLIELIKGYNPQSLKTAVIFQKMNSKNLQYDYHIDYLGFLIPNEFVVGFGCDYNEEFRQLDHLCSINSYGIETFKLKK